MNDRIITRILLPFLFLMLTYSCKNSRLQTSSSSNPTEISKEASAMVGLGYSQGQYFKTKVPRSLINENDEETSEFSVVKAKKLMDEMLGRTTDADSFFTKELDEEPFDRLELKFGDKTGADCTPDRNSIGAARMINGCGYWVLAGNDLYLEPIQTNTQAGSYLRTYLRKVIGKNLVGAR